MGLFERKKNTHERFVDAVRERVSNPSQRVADYINHYESVLPIIASGDYDAIDKAFGNHELWFALTEDEQMMLTHINEEA